MQHTISLQPYLPFTPASVEKLAQDMQITLAKPITIHCADLTQHTATQFLECSSEPFVLAASLMPDAHQGYVAPIGSVLITEGVVVPAWVGYDIGCGVSAVVLRAPNLRSLVESQLPHIYTAVKEVVPMGLGKLRAQNTISVETKSTFTQLLETLRQSPHDAEIVEFITRKSPSNLGTLGEGNHFIELSVDSDKPNPDEVWIVIHSGSRNIGHKVATKYMKKSVQTHEDSTVFEKTAPLSLESVEGKEYMAVLDFGLEFALLNRLEMAYHATQAIASVCGVNIKSELWTNKNHNHAIPFSYEGKACYIHRKGATPAAIGERGVIPANMRDGSYLVEGLGNESFLWSSSHGAGRRLGRAAAKKEVSMSEFSESMQGILGTVTPATLDEAPQVYKDITQVMSAQSESVKIIRHLKPLINWKGEEKERLRKCKN